MKNLKSLTTEELKAVIKSLGEAPYRASQIREWILKGAESLDDMTNIPKGLREKLAEGYSFEGLKVIKEQISADGTRKYLLLCPDGESAEAVFMKYEYGNSACLSTQVGCNMGCSFCASTLGGKVRDLKAWEILDEFIALRRASGEDINHIVLMGMGEPFDNYEEVSSFLREIHDPKGINLSWRNITVSSCGIIPYIYKFAEDFPQVNLAISLHAPNDELRRELMPVASAYSISELMDACREYVNKTGRRITFEYSLFNEVNDTFACAEQLARLLKGLNCHVNLIAANEFPGGIYKRCTPKRVEAFRKALESKGINATLRREMGSDIMAACGQLRRGIEERKSEV